MANSEHDKATLRTLGRTQTAKDAEGVVQAIIQSRRQEAAEKKREDALNDLFHSEVALLLDDLKSMGIDPNTDLGKQVFVGVVARRLIRHKIRAEGRLDSVLEDLP